MKKNTCLSIIDDRKLATFICVWLMFFAGQCVASSNVYAKNHEAKAKQSIQHDVKEPSQAQAQAQKQQPQRDTLQEEGDRQVAAFNNMVKWLNDWGLQVGVGAFALAILIKMLARRNRLKPRKVASDDNAYGSARFAFRSDIKYLLRGYTQEPIAGELVIGRYEEKWRPTNKKLWLNRDLVQRHTLVLGPSGCGKTRSIFMPNCATSERGSFIATDPKSELWKFTAGKHVNRMRFAPKEPDDSMEFNFIASCKDEEIAERVAAAIVQREGDTGEQYWQISEQQLLQAAISHVAYSRVPTPTHLYELLCSGIGSISKELSRSQVETTRRLIASYVSLEDKMKAILAQSLVAKLTWLENSNVRRFTSSTKLEFDFSKLRKYPTQVYWCLSEDDIKTLQPLTTIFFNLALVKLKKADGNIPVTLFLDEFANIGKLSNFDTDITILRGRDIGIVAGIQSISQLETIYGRSRAETIFGNFNNKIVFNGVEIETAERISKLTGDTTYREITESRSRRGGFFRGESTITESQHAHARRLLTADEVRRFDKNKLLLISTDLPPISVERMMYTEPPAAMLARDSCDKEIPTPRYTPITRNEGNSGVPIPDFPSGF